MTSNGWLNGGSEVRPETRLLALLNRHKLPALRYEASSSPSSSSSRIEPVWPHLAFRASRGDSAIHKHLLGAADVLHPTGGAHLGRAQASRDDSARLGEYFDAVTRQARAHAHRERMADVHALSAYLDIHLRQPLHVFLESILAHVPGSFFWRAVADGDRTGWELRAGGCAAAYCFILWPGPGRASLAALVAELSAGSVEMGADRRLRYRTGRERDDVLRLGEEVLHKMFARGVDYCIVTDYTRFVLFMHAEGVITVVEQMSTPSSLYHIDSPLAVFLATTLYALRSAGVDIAYPKPPAPAPLPWTIDEPARVLGSPCSQRSGRPSSHSTSDSHSISHSSHSLSPRAPAPLEQAVTPPALGPVSLAHAWATPEGMQYSNHTLARTMFGPLTPPRTVPRLTITGELGWQTLMGTPDAFVVVSPGPGSQRAVGALWTVSAARLQMADGSAQWDVVDKAAEHATFKDNSGVGMAKRERGERGERSEREGGRKRPHGLLVSPDQRAGRGFGLGSTYSDTPPPTSRRRYTWTEARAAIAHEARIYAGPLAGLQGSVVPRFMGLFGRLYEGDEIWHMVLEDVGVPLRVEERGNPVVQTQIRALYATLHAAGIRHCGPAWRHILRRGAELRLVDFDRAVSRACVRDTEGVEGWERACEVEREKVEAMLRCVEGE